VGTVERVAVVDDELSLVFSALADPTRRAILERLARSDATVNQLAEPFAMTQQAVSKHLKVLERAHLISRTRTAQSRPCALDTVRLDEAAGWIARHRQVWAELNDGRTEVTTHQTNVPAAYLSAEARAGFATSLDRFDAYLAGLTAAQEHQHE
jgi:DNA-binding transcriptional ArsR family regulator